MPCRQRSRRMRNIADMCKSLSIYLTFTNLISFALRLSSAIIAYYYGAHICTRLRERPTPPPSRPGTHTRHVDIQLFHIPNTE